MKPRLYLLDAHAYLHRAYHALPPLTNSKGEPVGALYGFARTLLQILKRDKPEGLAVCFDVPGPTFRHKAYAAYKSTRKEIDKDLLTQLGQAKPLAEAMGFHCVEKTGYEADDIMATMARKAVEHGWEAVLVTGDKDALQLVGKGIRVFNVSKNVWMDPPQIEEKFGIPPAQVLDYLAIVGDSSDNVPGLKGVGPVGAVKLLKSYGSLKGAISAAKKGDWALTPKLAQTLKDGEKTADLSLQLIALDGDVPLETSPEDCRVKEPDPVNLTAGLERYEFHSLIKELGGKPPELAKPAASAPAGDRRQEPCAELRKVELTTISRALSKAERVVVSVVPDGVGEGELLSVSRVRLALGLEDGRAVVLDESAARGKTVAAVLGGKALKVGWGLKAARAALDAAGLTLKGPDFDCKLAAYCLDPGAVKDPKALDAEAAALARAACALNRAGLVARMKETKVLDLFEKVEMPLSGVLRDMEREGIMVDEGYLRDLSQEFDKALAGLLKEIETLAGAPLNPQSPKQLGEVLFDKLGLPVQRKTAKGGRSTDEETLQFLAASHILPGKVLEYREIAKLESTYVQGLLQRLDPGTRRVHTTFDQTGTLTGRLSSLDPNLQNIPIRSETGRRIRRAFTAPKGKLLVSADYSQIDLRVLAHESEDPTLMDSFVQGEDIHRRTAGEVFHLPPNQVTADQRRAAKAINFGIVYGQTAFGLAAQLGVSQQAAGAYIKSYLERYPGVSAWVKRNLEKARREGCVRTLLGRVRWLPELAAENTAVRQFTERAARNTPIQGGSADIIKLAMLEVASDLAKGKRDAKMLLQVHDELLFEVRTEEVPAFARWVKGVMEGAVKLKVPVVVEVKAGLNWQDMEDLK
ncbi:MAG TPA: DNA polymerase I [Elusimicrobia bacterium]|nr:MAG: DNA polymerase I [Elusimicrobia bacterium GWA2_66_18]OGR72729.1 MAG: DNA polymerase I [Elusimicrobia bacterium GWC2_65_9]HAZ08710.1 DNA polymerase I [Elusimicrobiota bacterium]